MNKDTKGWEIIPTAGDVRPEAGGRVQFPVKRGETAFSFHTRRVDILELPNDLTWEHRLGFDVRADVVVGLWFETTWTHLTEDLSFKNQFMTTIGSDYTIGVGNGLGIMLEHMIASDSNNTVNFTAVNFNYPVSLFGNANAILYYDWFSNGLYSFAGYNYQINNITLYLMGYLNPKINALPMQSGVMRFTGKGMQLMAVWNY